MFESNRTIVPALAVRAGRRCKLIAASLALPDGSTIEIMIRNMSPEGVGAFTRSDAPAPGTPVTITLGRIGSFPGAVRWRHGQGFGIALDRSVDLGEVAATLREPKEKPVMPVWETGRLHQVEPPRPRGIMRRV